MQTNRMRSKLILTEFWKLNLRLNSLFMIIFLQSLTAQQELRMLTFNIWQEGTSVENGLDKIKDVIVEVNPDVICFTEVRNYKEQDWTKKIVAKLSSKGFKYNRGYAGGDVSLISKYPIKASKLIYEGEGSVAIFELELSDKEILVACAHLDYTNYACYLPRGYNGGDPNWNMIDDGQGNPKPVTDVNKITAYNLKSERDEQIKAFLMEVESESRPVVLMGDFNEPSHLDWTEKTKGLFHHNGVVIKWDSTYSLFKNGYTDAFRAFYPNEDENPGITWPSYAHGKESTSWTPKADERDRIDFVFYKGKGISTIDAAIVGPKQSYAFDKLSLSHTEKEQFKASKLEWPSDHKAVLCVLKFE